MRFCLRTRGRSMEFQGFSKLQKAVAIEPKSLKTRFWDLRKATSYLLFEEWFGENVTSETIKLSP